MKLSHKSQQSHISHKSHRIFFVGGGTLGHVYPNLAVIKELNKMSKRKKISFDIFYAGKYGGSEKEVVLKEGLKYKGIISGKLRRYWSWKNITDIFFILIGFFQSFFILLFNRPNIIFAKGGFVTVPFCLAAWFLRIPFVIHESDTVLGLSNKILSGMAKKIYLGFPIEAYKTKISFKKMVFVGNPIREEIYKNKLLKKDFYKKYGLNQNKKIIFVFGGSQGAESINKLINDSISKLVNKYILIHQTGKREESYFKEGFFDLNEKDRSDYLVFGYIGKEMSDFINHSDLIISRAGANSIAEILSVRKLAIFIPLSTSASDHQKRNANFLQKNGVASVLEERILTSERLCEEIEFLISNKKIKDEMLKNMNNIFPENSSKKIAESILFEIKK